MNDLNSVTSEVWSSMANTSLEPSGERVSTAELNGYVVSSVQVAGAWEGSVRLDMNLDMARTTTASCWELKKLMSPLRISRMRLASWRIC